MEGIVFKNLDPAYQEALMTSPMGVSSEHNPDNESTEQFIATRDRFLTLPDDAKDKLSSLETASRIKTLRKLYSFDLYQTGSVSRLVRNYYFGDVHIEDFPRILMKETGLESMKAQELARIIVEKIISAQIGPIAEKDVVHMAFLEALKKSPQLGEQSISQNPIRIKIFENPVRPSIKNWVTDYQQVLGVGRHEMMDRANYVFKGENGKRLTPAEREKLAYVLKALDENLTVSIDANAQQLIFPAPEADERRTMAVPSLEIPRPIVEDNVPASRPTTLNGQFDARSASRLSAVVAPAAPQGYVPSREMRQARDEEIGMKNLQFSSPQQFTSERGANTLQRGMPNPTVNGNTVNLKGE